MTSEAKSSEAKPVPADEFGIVAVFANHLDMSLSHMHPEQAFEAAQHATRAYLKSYDFVSSSYKGSTGANYQMVRKRGAGGGGM